MINRVKAWLKGSAPPEEATHSHEEHVVASAALLIEAGSVDGQIADTERAAILTLLRERFELSDEETQSLFDAAAQKQADAPDAFRFAHIIRQAYDEDECVELVEMLWMTVLADGHLDDFEANLIRRVVGLLHLTDRAGGEARKRAMAKLGQDS